MVLHKVNIVDESKSSIFSKLNPAVPRYYLFGLAGAFWTFAGLVLCARAIFWLDAFPLRIELALETMSIVIAIVGYLLLFVKVVE